MVGKFGEFTVKSYLVKENLVNFVFLRSLILKLTSVMEV